MVEAVMYSPDSSKLATGGDENGVKIWDAKTGELLNTLKHDHQVFSLAWTSDGKKFIFGSYGPIRIFDTATWQQIAILEGHTYSVWISLSQNNCLLASVSLDHTARLWNVDTNLQVGPPLQHEEDLRSAALSPDAKVLVTGCHNKNVYAWDGNATRRLPIQARRIPQDFFDGVQNGTQSSAARSTHPRYPAQYPRSTRPSLLERWLSLFRHSRPDTDGTIELQQRSRLSIFSHQGPRIVETPTVQDRKALYVARPAQNTQQQVQSHGQGSSTAPPVPGTNTATPDARPAHSRLVRLLAHLVLFLCCASPQHADGNPHPTQQQSQGQAQTHFISSQAQHQQGQPQAQVSSSPTQPAPLFTSAIPTALDAHTTAPGVASGQPRPLPLRTRFVLFLCCTSLPHADGH
ncbi:WD40-repeat-containing domain protein [Suillus subalutaceus]|uniref:WD40-repeat-containing domain protein n=1 Tax=Suillus subalutaceus TaxID=48586 RepID=UPI001B87E36D|nr:WD40-repeat-containing domain protein [Suillus subalutaceus]KAG1856362.1 WD40-repeat-containing domain protein [Suillus subalutaceus]